ncbi:MAG: apolipoprotein N-acyltransferase [Arenicellales bacterium]
MKYLLALVAGLLNVLSFSPFEWWYLLVPSFMILFLFWYKLQKLQAFWIGYMFGVGQFGAGISWVYISIQTFGGMPPLLAGICVLVFVLLLSLFPAIAGWLQALFGGWSFTARVCFIMPLSFLLFEWLRGWIFTGLPWLSTGYAVVNTPLSGLAPVGGIYLVGLVLLVSIGVLVATISDLNKKTAGLLLIIIGSWIFAWQLDKIPWSKPSGEPFSVALIQNNVPLLDKWSTESRAAIIDEYIEKSQLHRDKDLIVWPEGALPDYLNEMPASFWQKLQQHPSDFAFGALYKPHSDGRYYNSIVAVSDQVSIYSKQHLVPFGEFFPMQTLLSPVLDYLTIPMSDFSAWDSVQSPLAVAGHRAAASICYEDAFPHVSRNQIPDAGFLLNVTEDMWFGNSLAPHQRLQMAQFRSRESERPMVRSSNNGLSSLIDWRGNVEVVAPQFKKFVTEGVVQSRTGVTPYVRFGDIPALILGVFLLLSALLFGRRSLR